ncbi:hypothetical protein L226DRAFT_255437 [Lentinus tigrinus ALCF2SS1-7]|uniref:uncharacterized protein n=1 Tax=Lentinus tigrinus ALCF2SS1-7 TaxID=1328758 RepID=UPI001166124C|nr:hypothetical protein L226DRAFT_255437 [Lentinus tigrinus ALCF2SS1-7]
MPLAYHLALIFVFVSPPLHLSVSASSFVCSRYDFSCSPSSFLDPRFPDPFVLPHSSSPHHAAPPRSSIPSIPGTDLICSRVRSLGPIHGARRT